MIEAWAGEVFAGIRDDMDNPYRLINVEAQERLGIADIILQFKKDDRSVTGNVDVKQQQMTFLIVVKGQISRALAE